MYLTDGSMQECTICNSQNVHKIASNYTGYIEGITFDIYECGNCFAHLIPPESVNKEIYNVIYKKSSTPGYDRYYGYAQKIKDSSNPLQFLAAEEANYFPVLLTLAKPRALKILEVGCGYGYMTYALRRAGHDAWGIDISKQAIEFATTTFGPYFEAGELDQFALKQEGSYDLIIATEVIEHVAHPQEFVAHCKTRLKPSGGLLLTTPNKEYAHQNSV